MAYQEHDVFVLLKLTLENDMGLSDRSKNEIIRGVRTWHILMSQMPCNRDRDKDVFTLVPLLDVRHIPRPEGMTEGSYRLMKRGMSYLQNLMQPRLTTLATAVAALPVPSEEPKAPLATMLGGPPVGAPHRAVEEADVEPHFILPINGVRWEITAEGARCSLASLSPEDLRTMLRLCNSIDGLLNPKPTGPKSIGAGAIRE